MIITRVVEKEVLNDLVNDLSLSMKIVLPANSVIRPSLNKLQSIHLNYGVRIEIQGDFSGAILLKGEKNVFQSISELMCGSRLNRRMLRSFSCELATMLAGSMITLMSLNSIDSRMGLPTFIYGSTSITRYIEIHHIVAEIEEGMKLDVYLLIEP